MPAFSSADPNSWIGLSLKQTALGTPNVSAAGYRFVKGLSGLNFDPSNEVVDLREGGDGLDWGSTYLKTFKGQGQLVFNVRPEIAAQLFSVMPGGATWSGATVPAIHTFHTGHASFPYSTLQIAYPSTDLTHLLSDVRFTGLTIEGNAGEPWKVTAPFTAISYGASAAFVNPTYGVATGNDAYHLYYQAPTYSLNGTPDSTISNIKLDVNLGPEEIQAQSVTLDDIAIQNRDVSIEVTRRYQNSAAWRAFNYGGATSGIAPTQAVATGSFEFLTSYDSGNNQRLFRGIMPLVSWREDKLTEFDPDGKTIYETMSGKVLKGATAALILEVRNSHASAY